VFFATSPASLERAYRRPGLSGSVFRRILQDSRIPLDMIPHEFERARARGASSFGGKFRGTQVRDVNPVNTVFGTLVLPPLAGD